MGLKLVPTHFSNATRHWRLMRGSSCRRGVGHAPFPGLFGSGPILITSILYYHAVWIRVRHSSTFSD